MQQYDNTNSGALFANDKRFNENSPNARGPLDVKCPCCGEVSKFWVSAWTKVSKSNQKFQSLALTPDDPNKNKPSPAAPMDDIDSDIPF